ncbi:unnamed protein product [Phyllotreta striolata]|uniref:Odorant receptor n=1 Tax=Phyllotreta striolata TaxID=444603 RepID=A0A9N9XUA5_PHYSR|nr:unnamed protein product [Phyllotreta striolata]
MNNVQPAVCSDNSMKDDPLDFIEKFSMYKLSYKHKRTSQIICYTLFGLIEFYNLLFLLEFAMTRNTALLKRYLVTIICQQPACLMFAIRPYFLKYLSTVQDFYFEYYASPKTPRGGFNASKILSTKIVCSILFVLSLAVQLVFVAVNHLHIDRSAMYHFQYVLLLQDFYPVYVLFVVVTYAVAAASAYIVVYPVVAAVYIVVHLQLQFQYLNDYLDREVKGLDIGEEGYQEAIRERLLFCSEGFYGILNKSPWIYWNRNNQNMMLMMLVNAKDPFKITLSGLFTLNYAMIVSAARLCYSFTTVAIKI